MFAKGKFELQTWENTSSVIFYSDFETASAALKML